MKGKTYPGYIPRDRIQMYLKKHTGTLVSKRRIARWINSGEIPLIAVPSGRGHRYYTKATYLDNLIRRYSD